MQSQKLAKLFEGGRQYIQLLDIEADIGHTFVHYLYTGQYETLGINDLPLTEEYRRSVLTYKASIRYSIPALEDMSKQSMEHLGRSIDILDMLRVAGDEFRHIQPHRFWYTAYLEEMVTEAFVTDSEIFRKDELPQYLGVDPCFLAFMMQLADKVHSREIQKYIKAKDTFMALAAAYFHCEKCRKKSKITKKDLKDLELLQESIGEDLLIGSGNESTTNTDSAESEEDQSHTFDEEFEFLSEVLFEGDWTEEYTNECDPVFHSEDSSGSGSGSGSGSTSDSKLGFSRLS